MSMVTPFLLHLALDSVQRTDAGRDPKADNWFVMIQEVNCDIITGLSQHKKLFSIIGGWTLEV